MNSTLTVMGSIILLATTLGQATAGPSITDRSYWPNEVGPLAYRHAAPYVTTNPAGPRGASQRVPVARNCTYRGGPKSHLWTCR
jgi:hypothetical protein